ITQEAQERAAALVQAQELDRKERTLERLRAASEAELVALRAKFEAEQAELTMGIDEHRARATLCARTETTWRRAAAWTGRAGKMDESKGKRVKRTNDRVRNGEAWK